MQEQIRRRWKKALKYLVKWEIRNEEITDKGCRFLMKKQMKSMRHTSCEGSGDRAYDIQSSKGRGKEIKTARKRNKRYS